MGDAIFGVLFHFGQHIADDSRWVVGSAWRAGGINGDVGELRPGQSVVEVIFAEVVLGQVGDVGGLHVGDVERVEGANVHFFYKYFDLLWKVGTLTVVC